MSRWSRLFAVLVFGLAASAVSLVSAVPPDAKAAPKKPAAKSKDAESARAAVRVPAGHQVEVWASEPLMANPVSLCFDGKGRVYVAETTRFNNGVPDTRGHMGWLEEDIGCRTIDDRLKMYEKHGYGKNNKGFTDFDDQIRMLWDESGDGVADKSTIFGGGFNQLKDGLGSGVLARKGKVYYTCIPDLYELQDTKGAGVADVKKSLATGFGLRVQFIGHDMHGLRMGPDGRLYFTIGDRGLNVVNKEGKRLYNPDSGAVLRCELDGSNMEIVHVGLRNPQELAFDDQGNLFTFDNNCDSGDRARWVYVVEGGDSGWRCGYQYGDHKPNGYPVSVLGNRGPWNAEKLWHLPTADQPAWVVPPLAHIGNGPAGITHYPGIGFNEKYNNTFFACDFTSNPGGSKIWNVKLKPKGAAFEVEKSEPFVQQMVPTDCEFGPDGAFYWCDWVGGWSPPGKGRIFRVTDPEAMKNPAVAEAKKLFAEGFEKKSADELAKLLEHPHQQIRLEAQWELTGRKEAVEVLGKIVKESKSQFARIHAVWGLGRLAMTDKAARETVWGLVSDADTELRAQVARVLGWQNVHSNNYFAQLVKLLNDESPRVQALAANAFGSLSDRSTETRPASEVANYTPIFEALKKNADKDLYLRQALVHALAKMPPNPVDLFNVWTQVKDKYDVPAVRLGMVLALRKLESEKLAAFLDDADPKVVLEAARAIHDQDVMKAMPDLALLSAKPGLPDYLALRALSANFKLGKQEHAARVAAVAARTTETDVIRKAALQMLAEWSKPKKLDLITGLTQNLGERPTNIAIDAVRPLLGKLFVGSDAIRKEAVNATNRLGIKDVVPYMVGLIKDEKQPVGTRVDALFALDGMRAKEAAETTKLALASTDASLRGAARIIMARLDPKTAIDTYPVLLKSDGVPAIEKQYILEALSKLPESDDVDVTLSEWLDTYTAGKVPGEIQLDVIEAARLRSTRVQIFAPLKEKVAAIDKAATEGMAKDHLAKYRPSLAGGDATRGREIFLSNSAVYCQRCHKLDGVGGEVGPTINGLGKDKTREYLLEAIVAPNKQIAKGFESVTLSLEDGRIITGVLRAKDEKQFVVVTAENKVLTIPKADVSSEKPDKSAMPEDLVTKMTPRDIRDLVEFLSSLKDEPKK